MERNPTEGHPVTAADNRAEGDGASPSSVTRSTPTGSVG